MGRKKQSQSATQASASSAGPAASSSQASDLAEALADVSLHSTPGAQAATSAPSQQLALTVPPPAPPTSSSSEPTPTPEYAALWAQVQQLHDAQGLGYIAAVKQLRPDVQLLAASGQSDRAHGRAAEWLCMAAVRHAEQGGRDKAIATLQAALKEAMTSIGLEHDATLHLSLVLALQLLLAEKYELSLKQWKWLLLRCGRLTGDMSDGFRVRERAARCLKALDRPREAAPLAYEAAQIRLRSHGNADTEAQATLQLLLDCDELCHVIPPTDMLPLLKKRLAYLRSRGAGSNGDAYDSYGLWLVLAELAGCYHSLGKHADAVEIGREWVQVTKKQYGLHHEHYMHALEIHAMHLSSNNSHAKAISLLTDVLREQVKEFGMAHEKTVYAATMLGFTYLGKGDVKTAVTTLSKAWESASALGPQHRGHQNLLQAYKVALMKANDRMAMIRLATEAMDRGFSQEMLMAAP